MRTSPRTTILTSLTLLQLALSSPHSSTPPLPPAQCAPGNFPSPFNPNLTTCLDGAILLPSAWHPWTHRPHCVEAADGPWCVFTRAALHGSISVVTTPDEAAGALNPLRHVLDDDDDDDDDNNDGDDSGDWRKGRRRPYEVRDVPGKGKGAVATRRIGKGTAVLADRTAVLAAVEYPADVMREEVQELLAVAAAQLRDPGAVEGLARQGGRQGGEDYGGDGEVVEMSEMEDIMLTNTFGVTVGGKEYMALFPNLARFNHACKPNAFINFSQRTLAMTVWAARHIEPGEEITITYTSAGLTSEERRESLKHIWGFKCQCSLCTASPDVIQASDARRGEIRSLQTKVLQLAQKGEFHKAVEAAECLFALVEEEGLTELMGGMYEVPARLYYHVGNLDKALEYTLKVKHELDAFGASDEAGQAKIDMLKGVIQRLEREIKEKENREAPRENNDRNED
ncbi:uncharacterized protein P884DRAFT_302838 [Thermothelomyces heterothallicus CBS 202.75]|uniref:uncharacterized protein n=1 Tax=Thermothelomyces heterothallicus CBS 202.75 TaxID=1149848 RepID=UPI00374453EA